ncbi:BREX-1 system adenine-specific DNA-methyltransferase PglX [Xanthomonas campestris]|uniref:BREX-1 system adenine-specific DNA-methyltransferase PglX n=1 Tax=Xanthomonas campestris TaxID=339 RepID=UPI002B23E4BA|nr:BREX-1 system adenine-specific DNA-methyltransferase PglX [Xanthomonas campestris]MEA9474520.1 BREX-1 system adenine-specific DNA-methyltransferase PglX [Xanthomonas campestris]MEB1861143.1 BREX-1 system adenine-specific DNA-methyltransferase PglX [Xanthomonas campestris pv. campestris]
MNTGNLKSYAPQARKDFIAAVTARANLLGLSEAKGALQIAEAEVKNDIVMIAGRPWPVKVNEQRTKLIARMKLQGFGHTVEAVAYAWFNRLAALRYMEVHDYLGHGRRVLSNPQGGLPEVLAHALELAESNALPGLSADTVRELKLANQDPQLYRLILIAQCNALHQAMPFLFEQLGGETELLLPENLLLTDSVVAKLVQSIPEADWQQIEIIGWLYQFYISEKKDQVIGKVVKCEDIPAATQLFTPNWIVKYMVQNSLGAQWLASYPNSPLRAEMAYYIEPAVQTDEVNAQLAAITPSSLNPEELTLIDPASGSGHILVEAYELFKAIYLERGYRQRDVAKLILEKNLFGLDIDERAAQLTGFALMMKGRADDRQLFERGVQLNVMALVDSAGFDPTRLAQGVKLSEYGLKLGDLTALRELFEPATAFGSLIQVPEGVAETLPALKQLSEAASQDLFLSEALKRLGPLVQQAGLLTAQYDAVVANPPYMGGRAMNALVKKLAKDYFPFAKSDLFACFIERGFSSAKPAGSIAMVTMHSWMFLSTFQKMRECILRTKTIRTMAHLGARAFGSISGEVVQATTFVLRNTTIQGYRPVFFQLLEGNEEKKRRALAAGDCRHESAIQAEFGEVPGSPVAYWLSKEARKTFTVFPKISTVSTSVVGQNTGDNERFLRRWCEVQWSRVERNCTCRENTHRQDVKWYPYNKGGAYRKWYGNFDYVINWQNDAEEIKQFAISRNDGKHWSRYIQNLEWLFRDGVTWSDVTMGRLAARRLPPGFISDVSGHSAYSEQLDPQVALAIVNSNFVYEISRVLNPTIHFQAGNYRDIPYAQGLNNATTRRIVSDLIEAAVKDWNAYERSWDFQSLPLLEGSSDSLATLESSYTAWVTQNRVTIAELKRLEEESNRLFIDAYGLADEVTHDVPIEQVTLTVNPAYRYGGKLTEEELWTRFCQDSVAELASYSIGCMMGRYSLDAPGLIYAHSGNVGFDASRYTKFPADTDGIVPLTEELWFDDDAATRVREFLLAVWGPDSLEKNMTFLADNLGRKANESPEQSIRRYLADRFFKDHLQTYKKRPIYWLFSSGKQGAFQALVYLHRYNAGTLSRLRAEYVVPLTGKMQTKIEELEQDVAASSSTAQRNKLSKQLEKLRKQHLELLAYDEQLRHFADQRIELDLDDGVKVNYGKFGDLLGEVKAVTGGKGDDE